MARFIVCLVLTLPATVALGIGQPRPVGASAALPNPHVFRIAASQFPWHTDFLLTARVESNAHAKTDATVIYDAATGPSWAALHRVTGWYEDALMKQGKKNPAVDILVSEYRSTADAQRAYTAELHEESYRHPASHPHLGSASTEFASSGLLKDKGKTTRVEDSTIYVRDQNLELDVAVYDSHNPKYHWDSAYRAAALKLASRLTGIANRVLARTHPTPTVTPPPTAEPTQTPTATPMPPTAVPATSVPTAEPSPTATSVPTIVPTSAAQTVQVSASVSNATPTDNSTVTVYGHFSVNGQGVAGVPMATSWYYKSTTSSCSGVTDSSGTASCSRDISRATVGYTVEIAVTFTYNGQTYSTSTGFTPQ